MKNRKRAIRRYHKNRMKRKARIFYPYDPHPEKLADHLALCSRAGCCGNPRRYFSGVDKITLQERKSDFDIRDWHKDL